jgi:hypothetical protein
MAPIPKNLDYVLYGGIWLLPLGHMLLLGLVKSLWLLLLQRQKKNELRPPYVLANKVKKELTRRTGHLRITGDFGRPLR